MDTPLFAVPDKLLRILNRDLTAAGIPKKDDRGWSYDVHCFRHTLDTLLAAGGVSSSVRQKIMRHAPEHSLTDGTYLDP
ncbi:MAG TPA: hypothetical protein PKY77_24835 [Phycisphaerae bacterium]|nr:hypothetical protein [Phycisphaerae bacterium]HRY68860.1 hypothetical protein [Phycisphaerae bacterium]HSA25686.1 hypothetical protein [Phycisphaerae bacterium]